MSLLHSSLLSSHGAIPVKRAKNILKYPFGHRLRDGFLPIPHSPSNEPPGQLCAEKLTTPQPPSRPLFRRRCYFWLTREGQQPQLGAACNPGTAHRPSTSHRSPQCRALAAAGRCGPTLGAAGGAGPGPGELRARRAPPQVTCGSRGRSPASGRREARRWTAPRPRGRRSLREPVSVVSPRPPTLSPVAVPAARTSGAREKGTVRPRWVPSRPLDIWGPTSPTPGGPPGVGGGGAAPSAPPGRSLLEGGHPEGAHCPLPCGLRKAGTGVGVSSWGTSPIALLHLPPWSVELWVGVENFVVLARPPPLSPVSSEFEESGGRGAGVAGYFSRRRWLGGLRE